MYVCMVCVNVRTHVMFVGYGVYVCTLCVTCMLWYVCMYHMLVCIYVSVVNVMHVCMYGMWVMSVS